MQRNVKNRLGQLLGWTREDNRTQYAYDRQGRLLGWYNKQTDHTHDRGGRLLTTSGNITGGLIFDADKDSDFD
jgi:YD repeat-containing protein